MNTVVKTENVVYEPATALQYLVNGEEGTGLQSFEDLAVQIAASAPIASLSQVWAKTNLTFATKSAVVEADIDDDVSSIFVKGIDSEDDGLGGLYIDENNGSTDTVTSNDGSKIWYRLPDIGPRRLDPKFFRADTPFGRAGMRIIAGERLDAHVGMGGWVQATARKRVHVYRKGSTHAINNQGEVWAADEIDGGPLTNHRLIAHNHGVSDMRVQKPRIVADGRIVFLVNRIAEDNSDLDPLLFKSDNTGVTFSATTLVRPVGSDDYSFDAHGGILDWPASQGGQDGTGFIAFGLIDDANLGALLLTNNCDNYAWHTGNIASPDGVTFATISESLIISLGSNRWLAYARNGAVGGGWRDEAVCWKIVDLLNWGPPRPSGISLGGNPPSGIRDGSRVRLFLPSRGGRFVDGSQFDNWLMTVDADVDELWTANGDFSQLSSGARDLQPFMPLPYWGTYYGDIKKDGDFWRATMTVAEDGEAGNPGAVAAIAEIGDFIPTGRDMTVWNYMFSRRVNGRSVAARAMSNTATDYTLFLRNLSGTAQARFGAYGTSFGVGYSFAVVTGDIKFDLSVGAAGNLVMDLGGTSALLIGTPAKFASSALVHISVPGSSVAAITTEAGSASARNHIDFRNPNGLVGSISTNGSATAYNTASDETLKDFIGEYDLLEAIRIIIADPVRDWFWKKTRKYAVGWGSQTSHGVSEDLATRGGWRDPITDADWAEGSSRWANPLNGADWAEGSEMWADPITGLAWEEGATRWVDLGTPNAREIRSVFIQATLITAIYKLWGLDQGKRTPYLWAAVTWLIYEVRALRKDLSAMQRGPNQAGRRKPKQDTQ